MSTCALVTEAGELRRQMSVRNGTSCRIVRHWSAPRYSHNNGGANCYDPDSGLHNEVKTGARNRNIYIIQYLIIYNTFLLEQKISIKAKLRILAWNHFENLMPTTTIVTDISKMCSEWLLACGGGRLDPLNNPRQGFRNFSPWKRCYAAMLLWWLVVAGLVSAAIFTSQRHWAVADNTLPKGYLCQGEAGGRDPPPQSTSVQTGGTSLQNIFECRQIFKYLWQTVTIPNGLEGPRTSLESLSVLTLWHLTALREMLVLLFYVLCYWIFRFYSI